MNFKGISTKLYFYSLSLLPARLACQGFPCIIYYHRVINDQDSEVYLRANPSICISKNLFHKQIEFLVESTKILSLNEFIQLVLNKKNLADRTALLTFDDGYLDNYENAFPVLKYYGVPATIFLTSGMIESEKRFWWDELYGLLTGIKTTDHMWEVAENMNWHEPFRKEDVKFIQNRFTDFKSKYFNVLNERMKNLDPKTINNFLASMDNLLGMEKLQNKREFLNWDEIREMSKDGIYFGSHTHTHPNLKLLSDIEIFEEFSISKNIIEKEIGTEIQTLSYPSGLFENRCFKLLEQCDYQLAFQSKLKDKFWNNFSIPRIPIKTKRSLNFTGNFSPKLFEIEFTGRMDKNHTFLKNIFCSLHLKPN